MTAALTALEEAWKRSDFLFALLNDTALHSRPIGLRHPFLFYLGHLPAFAWNQIGRGELGLGHANEHLDGIFERGIDPPDAKSAAKHDRQTWPTRQQTLAYRDDVRSRIRTLTPSESILYTVVEHEQMHHETLLYMFAQLPVDQFTTERLGEPIFGDAPAASRVRVPGGDVTIGAAEGSLDFGWDNEFPAETVAVDPFDIESVPVSLARWAAFVEAGGYDNREIWEGSAWRWRMDNDVQHPVSWRRSSEGWQVRDVRGWVPLSLAAGWPVQVSLAEARAFAKAQGARLPTEAELHLVAQDAWDAPSNVDFETFGRRPIGESTAVGGLTDLVGNVWQWTETPFLPRKGFKAIHPAYPGYSADFFDGHHFVVFGASWATAKRMVRPSFRNWYQRHYPYVFAGVRLAWDRPAA